MIVNTRPAPEILSLAIASCSLKNAGGDGPHDNAEYEETHCEESVVDGNLFGALMATSEVVPKDKDTECHRYTSNSQYQILRPNLGILSPCWEVVSWRKMSGGVEYRQGCGE